jgi:hypothetical protein
MVSDADFELRQTAWLFTREHESVRVQVEEVPQGGFELVVLGPGESNAAYDFTELPALEQFRLTCERDLVARGFRLQAVAERRKSADRREESRGSSRDRRR